jgi:hypothetical protein
MKLGLSNHQSVCLCLCEPPETVPRQQQNILKFLINLDRIHSSKFCLCCYKVHTLRHQMAVKMENGFKKLT